MACLNICSHKAITIKEDECGFLYPDIDEDKCVNCGLCHKQCPVNNEQGGRYPIMCYAATLRDNVDLKLSASGGAATAFMRHVVKKGGVVYGCDGHDVFHVRHTRIISIEEVESLRGSKYVQSYIGDVFSQVKEDLKAGKMVLFSGLPCQVAGLKTFLRVDYKQLITIDLVCHGVPSQKMLTDNIHLYTRKENSTKIDVAFRRKTVANKEYNTRLKSARIEFGWFCRISQTREIQRKFHQDPYMLGFLSCLTFRPCCYSCRYASSSRVADITLGDFWGIGDDAGMPIGKGVSACLINTERGRDFFNMASQEMNVVCRDPVEAIVGNGQLQRPSNKHRQCDLFQNLYPKIGLKQAIHKCLWAEKVKLLYVQPIMEFIRKII